MVKRRIPVEPQVEVRDGSRFVARLDLADRESMFGGEYDGEEWHTTPEQRERDRTPAYGRRELGWIIVVLRKENLFGPRPPTIDRIATQARERARSRRGTAVSACRQELTPARASARSGSRGSGPGSRQKIRSPDLRRLRSSLRASVRISAASSSERRSFT